MWCSLQETVEILMDAAAFGEGWPPRYRGKCYGKIAPMATGSIAFALDIDMLKFQSMLAGQIDGGMTATVSRKMLW